MRWEEQTLLTGLPTFFYIIMSTIGLVQQTHGFHIPMTGKHWVFPHYFGTFAIAL